jgi:hypothetical protein
LDENFINCYEDVDLCLRLRQAGLEVVYRPDGCVVHHEGRTEGRGDHVTHSWLVLQEKWAGRLPFDEDEILREDGWRAVREGGTLVLKRRGVAGDPQEDLSRALALLESGHTGRARVHLERALPHLDAEARRDVQSLMTQLPAMPARGSVAAHRPAMESGPGVL